MKKTIIAAKSDNNAIGIKQTLPWHMPADIKFFLAQIQNGYLLTGRNSYLTPEGLGLFAKRKDVIVVTRQKDYQAANANVVHSVEEAFALAETLGVQQLNILGGAEIYAQTIHLADEMIITEIHAICEGDTFFPEIDLSFWKETKREDHPADEENPHPYSFVWYQPI
ncbi:dihydrofolate reductase [Haliscomenobacter hydrossis]|uniref:Dihydrofolate reductase n=1 Tax=Haliscomenobacter hydrossis (strain ATCC 27775 / DSM 1100 / LMG 10767 / O) TaxID=760192 RepID=F4KVT6_HALH1|nr:dihydrofolate reductase [Haliscomenobacter hydrossis]AEE53511.1 dihydrofolate reductase region [Haliscomenobacter hydrossis DSM 1100]